MISWAKTDQICILSHFGFVFIFILILICNQIENEWKLLENKCSLKVINVCDGLQKFISFSFDFSVLSVCHVRVPKYGYGLYSRIISFNDLNLFLSHCKSYFTQLNRNVVDVRIGRDNSLKYDTLIVEDIFTLGDEISFKLIFSMIKQCSILKI